MGDRASASWERSPVYTVLTLESPVSLRFLSGSQTKR